MKKTLFMFSVALLAASSVCAQKKNVSQASSLLYETPVNYSKAIALIDQAKADSTTSGLAHTWYVAGRIGYSMVNAEVQKTMLQQPYSVDDFYKGLSMMHDNYMQADARDGQPDKKGNPKYTERKNIRNDFKEYQIWYLYLGVDLYNSHDYERASVLLEDYMSIADNQMFTAKDGVKVDSLYAQALYMAAVSAVNNGQEEKSAKLIEQLKNTPSDYQQFAYELLATEYEKKNDMDNYVAVLREGVSKFPSNTYMSGLLINYYLSINKYDEGVAYLDQMIAQNPGNIEYLRVKASVLIQVKKYDDARVILDECIRKDPSDMDSYYYMGLSWAKQGESRFQYADDNWKTLGKEYDSIVEESKSNYRKALEYFETAHQKMSHSNGLYKEMLQNMQFLYSNLGNRDKFAEIRSELEGL
ncbi:MAG: tetratricopeptide repeat protein [Paludibacteraceae bacterium]|nr:tetratricopeptide repeat protein [Paludibacteraceae bacterium]